MTTVVRCDVCRTHSDAWLPKGWKRVSDIGALALNLQERNVCPECWEFLIKERGQ